eukprot:COSAG04_NODE_498_length_13385_cov_46.317853_2_plen_86_part_00
MKFSMGVMGVATFILSYTFAFLRGWQLAAVMSASIPVLGIVMGTSATFVGKMATRSTEACECPAPTAATTVRCRSGGAHVPVPSR